MWAKCQAHRQEVPIAQNMANQNDWVLHVEASPVSTSSIARDLVVGALNAAAAAVLILMTIEILRTKLLCLSHSSNPIPRQTDIGPFVGSFAWLSMERGGAACLSYCQTHVINTWKCDEKMYERKTKLEPKQLLRVNWKSSCLLKTAEVTV